MLIDHGLSNSVRILFLIMDMSDGGKCLLISYRLTIRIHLQQLYYVVIKYFPNVCK